MTKPQALIVDDNALNAEIVDTLLRTEGFESIIISTPEDIDRAIDNATNLQIIFLDIEFPNHDGFDVIKDLKGDPRVAHIPIAAYSVHTSEFSRARKAGFTGFIAKPLNPEKFPEHLANLLNGKPVWDT